MRIRYDYLFILVFIGLLFAQAFPFEQSLSSGFASFPIHDNLVTFVTELRLKLGDRVYHDVVVGSNHWLVYATDIGMDKFQNVRPLTDAELINFDNSLMEFTNFVEERGAHLYFVAAPYKNTIYPEYVPGEIPQIGSTSRLDQILKHISGGSSLRVLDLRPALNKSKKSSQIYYSTDSHWNDLGGYAAYRAIMALLQPDYPELSIHPFSDFEISMQSPKIMDLSYIIGDTSLAEERVQLKFRFKQTGHTKPLVLPSGRQINFSRNENQSLPTALFFHDSFLYSVMPFLSEHFGYTFYVDMLGGGGMLPRDWVDQFQPDVVLIVLNEHFIDLLPQLLEEGSPVNK